MRWLLYCTLYCWRSARARASRCRTVAGEGAIDAVDLLPLMGRAGHTHPRARLRAASCGVAASAAAVIIVVVAAVDPVVVTVGIMAVVVFFVGLPVHMLACCCLLDMCTSIACSGYIYLIEYVPVLFHCVCLSERIGSISLLC